MSLNTLRLDDTQEDMGTASNTDFMHAVAAVRIDDATQWQLYVGLTIGSFLASARRKLDFALVGGQAHVYHSKLSARASNSESVEAPQRTQCKTSLRRLC
jgi:hypothetical protein